MRFIVLCVPLIKELPFFSSCCSFDFCMLHIFAVVKQFNYTCFRCFVVSHVKKVILLHACNITTKWKRSVGTNWRKIANWFELNLWAKRYECYCLAVDQTQHASVKHVQCLLGLRYTKWNEEREKSAYKHKQRRWQAQKCFLSMRFAFGFKAKSHCLLIHFSYNSFRFFFPIFFVFIVFHLACSPFTATESKTKSMLYIYI